MKAALARKVLRPRPGKAICSFWQGRVEIALWILEALVGSFPALIAASVARWKVEDLDPNESSPEILSTIEDTKIVAWYLVAITVLTMIFLLLFIILRICNIGAVNFLIEVFLIMIIIINTVMFLGHLAGGIVAAIFAIEWTMTTIEGVALISSSAFCFMGALLLLLSVIWDILYLVKSWNNKVVKYTVKAAIKR